MSPYRNEAESHETRVAQLESSVGQSEARIADEEELRHFVDPERLKKLHELRDSARGERDVHRRLSALDRYKMAMDGFVGYLRELQRAIAKPSSQRITAPLRQPAPHQKLPQLEDERRELEEVLAERTTSAVIEHGFEPRMEGESKPGMLQVSWGRPGQGPPLLCVQARLVYRGTPMLLRQACASRSGRGGLGVHLRCRVAPGLGELWVRQRAPEGGWLKKALNKETTLQTGDEGFDQNFAIAGDPEAMRRALSPVQRKQLNSLWQRDKALELVIDSGTASLALPNSRAAEMVDDALPLLAYLHGLNGERKLVSDA